MPLKNDDLDKAREVKIFLEKNYQEHYDYTFLTKKFAINKFKLKLAFKAVANDNVHVYITKVRIEKAKHLLDHTDYTVGLIAVKVGLDKSNFNLQFKKLTGLTPTEWRKRPFGNTGLYAQDVDNRA
jgi:AraC-like DNA-binding protein